jgi:hypothetical protein
MIIFSHAEPLPPAPLLKAACRMLRSLLQTGLTFPVLADALRSLFVEVAVNDILTDPKSRTERGISLPIGVHRKEIKRLREMPWVFSGPPEVLTLASRIAGRRA